MYVSACDYLKELPKQILIPYTDYVLIFFLFLHSFQILLCHVAGFVRKWFGTSCHLTQFLERMLCVRFVI